MTHFSHASVPLVHLTLGENTCVVSLFGGHVLSYTQAGVEKLFMSKQAKLDGSRPIRGGIPVCWPWFGQLHPDINEHKLAHGLVRQQLWELDAKVSTAKSVSITLSPTDLTHPLWPQGLTCQLIITLTHDHLEVKLLSHNKGEKPVPLSCALHSYFAIDDLQETSLIGITGEYSDNANEGAIGSTPETYRFTGEVDRIHPNTDNILSTDIYHKDRPITAITHAGHDSLVVWNPWRNKSQSFVDFADDEYLQMICVETALTQHFELAPHNHHHLIQTIA